MSDTLEESLPAHAPLGPSSAEGWSTCADYVNANRGLPDHSTQVASEGTAAHVISDICLQTGLDAEELVGVATQIGDFRFVWDEDDAMLLQPGIEATRADGGEFHGEQRVDVSPWTLPGQFGTLDRASVMQDPVDGQWWVVVRDLKWGRGVAVSPVRNKQIMLYALAYWRMFGSAIVPAGVTPRFRLVIDQPRHAGGGGVWHTTLADLEAFGDWIRERAALTAVPVAPRTASRGGCIWCRRCRAPGGCDAFDTYMIALLGLTWHGIDLALMMGDAMTLPRELTPERRAFILLNRDMITRWLEQLGTETMADAYAGAPTGDLKAVDGNKTPDKWRDKGVPAMPVVRERFGAQGFTERLKTPKQIGTLIKDDEDAKQAIEPLIERGRPKPILVPLEDARSPIVVGAKFDDLNDEEGND